MELLQTPKFKDDGFVLTPKCRIHLDFYVICGLAFLCMPIIFAITTPHAWNMK